MWRELETWFLFTARIRGENERRNPPVLPRSMRSGDRTISPRNNPRRPIIANPKYEAFAALDPFFDIVQRGLAGQVDGDHYFDTIADNAVFEFRYVFPGWPQKLSSREELMALYAGYGNNIFLDSADALVVHRSQDAHVVILEYEVHGKIVKSGAAYNNRFISVITIENRKIVQWRDYMDSLTAMTALRKTL